MEGIVDGRAVDSCFYCALLYPGIDDCPRCKKRLRYQPAHMAPVLPISQVWAAQVQAFQSAPTAERAQALLESVHRSPEELEAKLGVEGAPSLERLRQLFAPPDSIQREEE